VKIDTNIFMQSVAMTAVIAVIVVGLIWSVEFFGDISKDLTQMILKH